MSTPFGISFSTLLSRAQAASRAEDAPWQLTRTRLTRRQVLRETKRGSARPWRLEKKAKSEHGFFFFFRSLVLSRLFTFFSFLGADALWPLTPLSLRQEKPRVSTFPQPPLSRPLQTIGVLPDFKPAIPASRTFFPDKESAHETRDIAFFISPRGTQHSLSSSFPAKCPPLTSLTPRASVSPWRCLARTAPRRRTWWCRYERSQQRGAKGRAKAELRREKRRTSR